MTLIKCLCGQPIGKIEGVFEGYCPKKGCRRLVSVDTRALAGVSSRA